MTRVKAIIFRVSEPATGPARFRICLEEYDPDSGVATEVDGTGCDFPEELIAESSQIFAELTENGGQTGIRARLGALLYQHIAATPAGREWLNRYTAHGDGSQGTLRAYLDIEPDLLRHLPWELMTNERDDPPFRALHHRPMRGHPRSAGDHNNPSADLPIHVLIVVCDIDMANLPRKDTDLFTPQGEIDAIFAALRGQPGIWHVEVLRMPTWSDLRRTLMDFQPQILHFIGDTGKAEEPAFTIARITEDGEAGTASLPMSELGRLVPPQFMPRLFVLNGCRTTQMTVSAHFRTLASRAIITNLATVYAAPSVIFSSAFYRGLAETGAIDEAVWQARETLFRELDGNYYDWGVPVLTVLGSPDTIFRPDLRELADKAQRLIASDTRPYDDVDLLVDRLDPSRRVWRRSDGRRERHLVLIKGQENAGKSHLLHACMLTWELRGHPVALIDPLNMSYLQGDRLRPSLKEILLQLCDELKGEFTPTDKIDRDLDSLKERLSAVEYMAPDNSDIPHPFHTMCGDLLEILHAATSESAPLMLAFDTLNLIIPDQLKNQVKESLLAPIAQGRAGHTYAVIAIAEREFETNILGWSPDDPTWNKWVDVVELPKFPPTEAEPLGREYGARKGWVELFHSGHRQRAMAEWIRRIRVSEALKERWLPSELHKLAAVFEQEWLR